MARSKVLWCAGAVMWGMVTLASAEDKVNVGVTTDVFSKYVWRGQNVVDDWVAQPGVSVGYKGFTGSVWGNLCLTDEVDAAGEFTEFDYALDYTAAVPGLDKLNFSVGTIYYRFPNQIYEPTLEVYGGLSLAVPLSPAVKVFYDVADNIDQDGIEGSYVQFSVGHTIEKLKSWTEECYCNLQMGASVGYGTDGYNKGYFGVDQGALNDLTLTVGLPICFGKLTIKPSIGYSMMIDDDIRAATGKSDNLWGGIGAAYNF